MRLIDNVTARSAETRGLMYGALGVFGFSLTLPATKAAVADLDPTVVGLGRAVIAAALACVCLAVTRSRFPAPGQRFRVALVSLGVVIGFPLFTALALHRLSSAHGAVITGLLPAATAVFAVLLARERPSRAFWVVCLAGLVSVVLFAVSQGAGRPQAADLMALAAVVLGALGYAQGAVLARELGGWRVICWALVFALPVVVPAVAVALAHAELSARPSAWVGFAYLSVVSMFLAFFAWYRGLALGGVARVSQVQLAQPVLTVAWSALLLGEHIGLATVIAGFAVLACAAASRRTRVNSSRTAPAGPSPRGQAGLEAAPLGARSGQGTVSRMTVCEPPVLGRR